MLSNLWYNMIVGYNQFCNYCDNFNALLIELLAGLKDNSEAYAYTEVLTYWCIVKCLITISPFGLLLAYSLNVTFLTLSHVFSTLLCHAMNDCIMYCESFANFQGLSEQYSLLWYVIQGNYRDSKLAFVGHVKWTCPGSQKSQKYLTHMLWLFI